MRRVLFRTFLLIFVIVLADQVLKLWIKTHMYPGEEVLVFGDWFRIHFTENNGMAFGVELSGKYGKLALTSFRVLLSIGIVWYLIKLIGEKAPRSLIIGFALIFAGAVGNILDSLFYGMLFGYAGFMHGKVVDMFYFPIIQTHLPEWLPFWGDRYFVFFQPVFNIADAAISVGVFSILLLNRKFFSSNPEG